MLFSELAGILKSEYDLELVETGEDCEIAETVLVDDEPEIWKESVLYFIRNGGSAPKPDRPVSIITDSAQVPASEGGSLARVASDNFESVHRRAEELLLARMRTDAALFRLAHAALGRSSIVRLINTAAQIVGNALILTDSGTKILAYSTAYPVMDPLWAENIAQGRYTDEFMRKVRSSPEMQRWHKQDRETHRIMLADDAQPKLVARITHKGHLIGGLTMIAHHTPVNDDHARLLPLIGRILFSRFNHDVTSGVYKPYHSTILFNLLDETSRLDSEELLDMAKVDFPEIMQVVVARYIQPPENRFLKRGVHIELERIFGEGFSVRYKGYIGIVVTEVTAENRRQLQRLAESEELYAGISWPFGKILDFRAHFYQAVAAIKQAQILGARNRLCDYTDFAFYDLLGRLATRIPLREYSHPALERLRHYDEERNTDFYRTLKVYVFNNRNLSDTADELFLHRNSLKYRIKKIREITGCDLNDRAVMRSLADSFRIEAFLDSTTER